MSADASDPRFALLNESARVLFRSRLDPLLREDSQNSIGVVDWRTDQRSPTPLDAQPIRERPYSLSLFQMAFWFGLVIIAYVFVWMINDELDTITGSVLALIGIGAGTAIGASMIDKSKTEAAPEASIEGADAFLRKIVSSQELVDTVNRVIALRRDPAPPPSAPAS